jgi:hypothetical protein
MVTFFIYSNEDEPSALVDFPRYCWLHAHRPGMQARTDLAFQSKPAGWDGACVASINLASTSLVERHLKGRGNIYRSSNFYFAAPTNALPFRSLSFAAVAKRDLLLLLSSLC